MSDTQQEEAKRCPWCNESGKFVSSAPVQHGGPTGIPRGTKIETYQCDNTRCEQSGERWAIQINPDGTIPPRGTRDQQDKFWDINNHTSSQERQRARDQLARMYEAQRRG